MSDTSWQVVDAERGILVRAYEFQRGAVANTLVFRGPEGLVVVSPGIGLTPADFDALAAHGEVRALVASNSYHHLGQTAWRARFPRAVSYAGLGAQRRLARKVPGVTFRPAAELPLPPDAAAVELPGCNNGELLLTVPTGRGALWYTGDVLANLPRLPPPPFGWLFRWSDSAPGYRLFRLGVWLFVKDKPALRAGLEGLLSERPPRLVVPGHGAVLEGQTLTADTQAQVARL